MAATNSVTNGVVTRYRAFCANFIFTELSVCIQSKLSEYGTGNGVDEGTLY